MPKNKIEDLRNILFETMEKLMDDDDPMDMKRAETIAAVAQVVVNSAKVEVEFVRATGYSGSAFIQGARSAGALGPGELRAVMPMVVDTTLSDEKLCQQCVLADCNETSPSCLVAIKQRTIKQAA